MLLKELFEQNITRAIETVIKADDRDHILQEVEEYVVTKEIAKKIRDFFSAYNDYSGVNGVWISGFFGSGKSHLLKILSYILENKEYNGHHLGELFAAKVDSDAMLKADVIKATKTSSESILFNIDQQAQITTKGEEDALLNVFYKVLNDHQGYFGSQRHVAEFERWLDNEGNYEQFKELFEKEAGEDWTSGRRKYFAPKTKKAVANALASINGNKPEDNIDIIDTLRKDNRISVEDFCEKVEEYIQKKEKGFRLNFFVDEVGQYIAENTKLMLNLQTIAESLATKCKGKAWILVTSQESLEKIVGDDTKSQSDDFSKIQGRFKIRVPLTSANVDEVIEKRLLTKTKEASSELSSYFNKEKANLETVLSFSDVGVQFKAYQDAQEFVNKYPFLPYQFDLFQQCIKELSQHNAFQGKHASVGERSMLGVFQEVLKKMAEKEHSLVSFDYLFEGIRSTIRGEIQNAITLAEKNLDNPLAIRILKILFLIKYYSNFKTTVRNISVLVLESAQVDLKKHDEQVKEALNILENQTYIQRNGEVFEFLTDDEKDIEESIKSVEIDDSEITTMFGEIIFDSIIGDTKIRFLDNKQDYEFTKRIDGNPIGREKELSLEVITPNNSNHGRKDFYKAQTMGYQKLLLFSLPENSRVLEDIKLYIKTERYIKQNDKTSNKETTSLIIREKGRLNGHRKRSILNDLKRLLAESEVYLNGTEHKVNSSADGKTKVINAFQDLVRLAYPNLNMIGGLHYNEDTIKTTIRSKNDDLFGADDKTISEAENEVYYYVVQRRKQNDRTNLNDIKEHFSRNPYGWYQNAIFTLVAKLYKRGKIEAKQDSNLLSEEDFLTNLLNNRMFSNTLIEPQIDFDQRQVKALKELYQDFFDEPCSEVDARDIAMGFKEKCLQESRNLYQLIGSKSSYPFLAALEPLAKSVDRIANMDYNKLITEVNKIEDEILDPKEELLDPIRRFWNGEQKKIFDEINTYIQSDQSNFEFVGGMELERLEEIQKDPKPFAGNLMKEAKEIMTSLQKAVLAKIEAERDETLRLIKNCISKIEARADFKSLTEEQQRQVRDPLNNMISDSYNQRFIANLRSYRNTAHNNYNQALNDIQSYSMKANEPKAEYIKQSNVKVKFHLDEIRTKEEVDAYIEAYKEELLRQIAKNRRITL